MLLMMSTGTASAQFILPQANESANCSRILNDFELEPKIVTDMGRAERDVRKAETDFGEVTKLCADGNEVMCLAMDEKRGEVERLQDIADIQSNDSNRALNDLLGCAIREGRISLNMIPYFISHFSNWLLGMIGIVAVLFIVIGGYQYILGGLTENKERGKKTIYNALMGMGLALLAWAIVNVIIAAITG